MTEPTAVEALSAGYVTDANVRWSRLVYLALSIPPKQVDGRAQALARQSKENKGTLKRKIEAVQWAFAKCKDADAIIKAGQHETLSRYIKSKKQERVEGLVVMKWSIAPDLKERVQSEVWRIAQMLKIKGSDQWWEFMVSVMTDWDEDYVKHLAGDGHAQKQG